MNSRVPVPPNLNLILPDQNEVIVEVNDGWELERVIEWVAQLEEVSLDCEATSPDSNHPEWAKNPMVAVPLLCQVGDDRVSYVIVVPQFTREQLQPLWDLLPGRTVVGQNLDYDYRLLRSFYQIPKWTSIYDTQLGEALLTAGDFGEKGMWLKQGLSLKVQAKKYLGIELAKEERDTFSLVDVSRIGNWRPTPEQVRYAGLDTITTMRIANRQVEEIAAENLFAAATNRFKAMVPIAEVEMRGMRIDAVAWREYLAELEVEKQEVERQLIAKLDRYEQRHRAEKLKTLEEEKRLWEAAKSSQESLLKAEWDSLSISSAKTGGTSARPSSAMSPSSITQLPTTPTWGQYKVTGMRSWRASNPNPGSPKVDDGPINLNSPDQVKRAYKAMGVHLPTETDKETGEVKEVCDAKAREKLLKSGELSPAQAAVLTLHSKYSKLSKTLGSFGENILQRLSSAGRLHTNYNIGLTETGRMSSENPNFQNFPRTNRLRHCFIADEGYVVITADFKSQELAIAAARSGDKQMARELSEGRDLYRELAVAAFGLKSTKDVDDETRHKAKSALLGVSYGLTPVGMERIHGVPRKDGELLIRTIKKRYPDLFHYAERNVEAGRVDGYVTSALGARRYFRNSHSQQWEIENQSKNAPIQGTAADVVYAMAARLEENLVPLGILPVNYVHDEAVVLAPVGEAEAARDLLVEQMQAAFDDVLPFETYGVRCGVDCHTAEFWTKD